MEIVLGAAAAVSFPQIIPISTYEWIILPIPYLYLQIVDSDIEEFAFSHSGWKFKTIPYNGGLYRNAL